ncbi:hypothetical protein BGZ46_008978 [Entomortierella lignicola]|nr:hypothetical protein BGZ46_008978 [Entomortierella lignicola]
MAKTGTINHVSLSASDYEQSKLFYQFFFTDLMGFKKTMDAPYCTMWSLGSGSGTAIALSPGNKTPHHKHNPGLNHLAFNVETKELIDEFYEKIVQFQEANKSLTGSVILDKPAEYPQYSPGYYAVFFTDPDGVKLELVYCSHH